MRAQALAKAAEAVARRDTERVAREKSIQAALADFLHAQGQVRRINADAEKAARPFDEAMRDAVRALGRLGETRAGIADLTGLHVVQVREYLAQDTAATALTGVRPSPAAGRRSRAERQRADAGKALAVPVGDT